jgi:hypothetical protein
MITKKTLSRLRGHAGLDELADQTVPSIASCTCPASALHGSLNEAAADAIDALSELNREVNGVVPSESCSRDSQLPRDLAYAVAEILRFFAGTPGPGSR